MLTPSPTTKGRGKPRTSNHIRKFSSPLALSGGKANIYFGDSLEFYDDWPTPTVIISDGAYGILGFNGDTPNPQHLKEWYLPHVEAWSRRASYQTTLWLWNTELGWATLHPLLEEYGWKFVALHVWDKGKAHIAGKNTSNLKHLPIVTEVCAQYVREPWISGKTIKEWLLDEWKRAGLKKSTANQAAGVKNAASRKYLDQGHLWYPPPPEAFERMVRFANEYGSPEGRPYFSLDGKRPISREEWLTLFPKFHPIQGWTNVWHRPPLKGKERVAKKKSAHLNQKPLDLTQLIIQLTSDPGDIVWEPFGGLFTGVLAAALLDRVGYGSEIDPEYYDLGAERLISGLTRC